MVNEKPDFSHVSPRVDAKWTSYRRPGVRGLVWPPRLFSLRQAPIVQFSFPFLSLAQVFCRVWDTRSDATLGSACLCPR